MQLRPHPHWPLATRLAGRLHGDLPDASRPEAHQVVASLRVAARRAGELAVRHSHLAGSPADTVRVTDRDGWVRGAVGMADHVLAGLPLRDARPGLRRSLVGLAHGGAGGAALGIIGRHLLGQFDAFSPSRTLYLLAPNILAHERLRGLDAGDFRLWVCIHEQTHAVQFSAASWLGDYVMERFVTIATDESGPGDVIANLAAGRGLGSAMASPEGHIALDEVSAAMTLVEGHADFVSDAVGRRIIPSVAKLRKAFSRSGAPSRLARLLPAIDKGAQYRDGLAFCRAVARRVGRRGLARAFDGPDTLPTTAEISDPALWLRRVHGKT